MKELSFGMLCLALHPWDLPPLPGSTLKVSNKIDTIVTFFFNIGRLHHDATRDTIAMVQSSTDSWGPETQVRDLGWAPELSSLGKGPWGSDPTHPQSFAAGQAHHRTHRHSSCENHFSFTRNVSKE